MTDKKLPQQSKPVAWMRRVNLDSEWDMYDFSANQHGDFQTPLFTTPQPAIPIPPSLDARELAYAKSFAVTPEWGEGWDACYKAAIVGA